eukprot:TRINITY_DN13315_c0_g1_i1.p1 TRINITY_DN13315_c0_g1~~TRINITY_DN13315_c0_g1_i1.p1  ORF type:complete len:107 (-),score=22.87 TRINITY_DN13315_c0_g1_i1:371-691(-)
MSHSAHPTAVIAAAKRAAYFKKTWVTGNAVPVFCIVSAALSAITIISLHHLRNNNFVVVDKTNPRPFLEESSSHIMNTNTLHKHSIWNAWVGRDGTANRARHPFQE